MKNAIAYIRVSREEQIKNYSLSNQKDYCRKYCRENDLNLVKIFEDPGRSATTIDNRPELIALLEYCRKNKGKIDFLLTYKIDRISRITFDFLEIKRRLTLCDVKIISVTEPTSADDPMSEFMETLIAAQARLDNAIRAERVKDGMRKRLEAGLPVNQPPVGYKMYKNGDDRSIPIRDEPKFSLLQKAGIEYLTGKYSFRDISRLLIEWGFTGMYGKKPTSSFVGKFFRCKFYKGIIVSKKRGFEYEGKYEQMFTQDEWDNIQEIALGKPFSTKKKERRAQFPLRRFVVCGVTGETLTGSFCTGKRHAYAYYYAPSRFRAIKRDLLETSFVVLMNQLEPSEGLKDVFNKVVGDKSGSRSESDINKFTEHFLYNLGKFWRTSEIDDKKSLQSIIFPKGLIWEYPGFRTPEICPLFQLKEDFVFAESSNGEGGGDRTLDTRLKRPLLYH